MPRCKECIHYAVCGKQRFMVQIDVHSFGEYNQVDGVEKYCYEYESPTTHVAPMAEVAREIFEEIETLLKTEEQEYEKTEAQTHTWELEVRQYYKGASYAVFDCAEKITELKKKYTEEQ